MNNINVKVKAIEVLAGAFIIGWGFSMGRYFGNTTAMCIDSVFTHCMTKENDNE